jgi:hypothetical protein
VVPNAMKTSSLTRNMPAASVTIFLAAVFCSFAILGLVSDISEMGQQSSIRFALGVALSGGCAVGYAYSGITLRGQFWKAFLPLFALQIVLMNLVAHWFPDARRPAEMGIAEIDRLQHRLNFDSIATAIAVSLSYAGFVLVFIRESRRHIRVQTEKTILDGEMEAARAVQQMILPENRETFPGYRVDSAYTPAQQVGGDFFQILPDGDGGMLVVVGDVAGKGLSAALLVSMLVGSIRTASADTAEPADMLRKLNDLLMGRTCGGFSTAIAAYIQREGLVRIANAGHLPPYMDGREIELPGALPLGITGDGQYQATSFELAPGSRLTFYTDGVVEARNQQGELFGFDRGREISTEGAAAIVEAAINFGQSDDITVVTIERHPD